MPTYLAATTTATYAEEQEEIKARLYKVGLGIIFNIVGTSSHLYRLNSNTTVCNIAMINDPNATEPKWKPARTQAITCARCSEYSLRHELDVPIRENTRRKKEKQEAFYKRGGNLSGSRE